MNEFFNKPPIQQKEKKTKLDHPSFLFSLFKHNKQKKCGSNRERAVTKYCVHLFKCPQTYMYI